MLLNELRRFWHEEDGTEMIEWAVVALIILASTVAVVILVGAQLRIVLCRMLASLGGQSADGTCPTS
jgi:Flp pilus assembly pilin Flp